MVSRPSGRAPQAEGSTPSDGRVGRMPFVGREHELRLLHRGLDDAAARQASLYLVVGEAGIGKTRLAGTFAHEARGEGFNVVWGRCWEAGGAPAYWPWVQVARACLRDAPPGPALRVLTERLRPVMGDLETGGTDVVGEAETDRFRLFDAVATLVRVAAEHSPLVVILDDLHAADEPSLLLLRYLVAELAQARLVVVAIHREPELDDDDPRSALLSSLAREPTARRVQPSHLTEAHIAEVLRVTLGHAPDDQTVRSLALRTEGNPLFVSEMSRLLADRDPDGGAWEAALIPPTVKQVIGRRLDRLSPDHRATLQLASVVGREFELDLLAELGVPMSDVLDAVGQAEAARIVQPGRAGIRRWRFSHVLVRDVLYESLALTVRKALHDRVGRAIERSHGDHLAELAHHAMLALPGGDDERARRYSSLAGARASAASAHEEAVRHHANALAALDLDVEADSVVRCQVLIDLGAAQRRAGLASASARSLIAAGELAQRLGRSEELARAAIAYGGTVIWLRAGADAELIPFLERALAARVGQEDLLRVRLLSRLAGALRSERDASRRIELSAEAVAIARELADPTTLVEALVGRQMAIAGPDTLEEMRSLTEEMSTLVPTTRDPELVADVVGWSRASWLTSYGPPPEVMARLVDRTGDLVEPLRLGSKTWYLAMLRNVVALAMGRYAGIEDAIERAHHPDDPSMSWDAEVSYRLARFTLARERGELAELLPLLADATDQLHGYWLFEPARIHALAAMGRADARASLREYVRRVLPEMPRDSQWLWALVQLADAATLLEDADTASPLLDLLQPYSSYAATAAMEVVGGPVSRVVGALADVLDRPQVAEPAFQAAIEMAERTSWRPWEAWSRYGYARSLSRSGSAQDAARAREQLHLAVGIARELGMPVLGDACERLVSGTVLQGSEPTRDGAEGPPPSMRREADVWAISFEGRTMRLGDSRGLAHLARLLGSPGSPIAAVDLAMIETPPLRDARAGTGELGGGARTPDPILDAAARAEYRARIAELEADIEEAHDFNDPERESRARAEVRFLARELAGAVGLGGRARQHVDAGERARQSVNKAIRAAIGKISRHDPRLADHLRHAIRTGALCSYSPDPHVGLRWAVTRGPDRHP